MKKKNITIVIIVLLIISFLVMNIYNNKKEIDYLNNRYDDMFDDLNSLRVRLNTIQKENNESSFSEYMDRCYHRGEGYVC